MVSKFESSAVRFEFPTPRPALDPTVSKSSESTSFAAQLASVLEGYLGTNSSNSHVEISVDAQPGQDSGTRQFVVTVKNPSATAPVPPAPASSSSPSTAATSVAPSSSPSSPAPTFTNEVDAYWATQPKEVQALKDIHDFATRRGLAQDLISKGYTIDFDIMVWGDDPYAAMKNRLGSGYTWVPSAGQNPIPVSPGLSFPGLPSYDPAHPPAGSILVSLDFAKGLEHTSPAWHGDQNPS
jgi:hypothetical protein